MTTLREAAQQALEALEGKRYTACGWRSDCDKAITALRAALAEPVQEPVAWGVFDGPNLHDVNFTEEEAHEMVRLKGDGSVVKPLYTAPPQRKPLTKGEISNIWDGHVVTVFGKNGINPIVFARAIEAKHGIGGQQ